MSESKVWLITGCSTGLGRALAEKVLSENHNLIVTARNPAQLADLAAKYPDTCLTLALDVTDAAQVESVVREAEKKWGWLDVLVNNAGYGLIGALEELEEAQIRQNFETNFFGTLRMIRAALPVFRRQKAGHIINISAVAGFNNYPGFSVYGASKFAIEGLSESVAAETRHLGIKVTLVLPGPFKTDFIQRSLVRATAPISDYDATSGKFSKILNSMNGRQPGDPEKAATAILQIASETNPPLRLVLGKYAYDKVRRKLAAVENELKTWESVGLPTDFST